MRTKHSRTVPLRLYYRNGLGRAKDWVAKGFVYLDLNSLMEAADFHRNCFPNDDLLITMAENGREVYVWYAGESAPWSRH